MDLLPLDVLEQVGHVLAAGARKYSAWGWKRIPDGYNVYKAALLRHLAAIDKGEVNDSETGMGHQYHAVCCALFMAWHKSMEDIDVHTADTDEV
jgi:hypothetical protein